MTEELPIVAVTIAVLAIILVLALFIVICVFYKRIKRLGETNLSLHEHRLLELCTLLHVPLALDECVVLHMGKYS